MATINVLAYIRVSTEKQVQEGEGLPIQLERIQKFCNAHGYNLVQHFSDEGISGAKESTDRDGLMDLITYCSNHAGTNEAISYVIVDKIDRVARKLVYQLFVEKELLVHDVRILYAGQEALNGDDDDMMITAMRQMMAVFAELERKMINKRLSDGIKKKAARGDKPAGRQPFGYAYDADGHSTVVVDAEAVVVERIFRKRAEGWSLSKVASFINVTCREPLRSKFSEVNRDRKFTKYTVHRILTNEYYRGILRHNGEQVIGNHEAIVNDDLWQRSRVS